jgi:hypothetical protein
VTAKNKNEEGKDLQERIYELNILPFVCITDFNHFIHDKIQNYFCCRRKNYDT